jgi:hypothetical protein
VPHPAEVSHDQRQLLRQRLPRYKAQSVPGAGQYIQEEQPSAVLAAVTTLDRAAR